LTTEDIPALPERGLIMPSIVSPLMVWLYNIGLGSLAYRVEKICDGSGEDPSCSRSVSGTSITDHLVYYGLDMKSDDPEACRIVT
ncbi:lipase-like, partial [Trifolium medium]|nr:lipase-like [Trifolium medium]